MSSALDNFFKNYTEAVNFQRSATDGPRKNVTDRLNKLLGGGLTFENYDQVFNAMLEDPNLSTDLRYIRETVEAYRFYQFPLIKREQFEQEFAALNKKHGFEIGPSSTRLRTFSFNSRAVISDVDPNTRTRLSVDLGVFEVSLSTATGGSFNGGYEYYVKANPVSDNKPKKIGTGTCYHPHINIESRLCLGSYNLQADIQKGDILSIFYNLCHLLNRYNPNSLNWSSAYIDNWVGHKCCVCSGFCGTEAVTTNTGLFAHKDCCQEHDGKYYSYLDVKDCTDCGVSTPDFIPINRTERVCKTCFSKKAVAQ